MTVKIERGLDRKYYVKLFSMGNEELLNISQGFKRHWNAKRHARLVFPDRIKIDANGDRFE